MRSYKFIINSRHKKAHKAHNIVFERLALNKFILCLMCFFVAHFLLVPFVARFFCNRTLPSSVCRNSSVRLSRRRRWGVERSSFARQSGGRRSLYPSFLDRQ